jgi:hypothetical protein
LYASALGVGPHGGCRRMAAAMINRCKKLHRAENLSSCSCSAFCPKSADAKKQPI